MSRFVPALLYVPKLLVCTWRLTDTDTVKLHYWYDYVFTMQRYRGIVLYLCVDDNRDTKHKLKIPEGLSLYVWKLL